MLPTSFIPGTTDPFAYVVQQLFASSPPTAKQPPALSWRFGQMRRWHPEHRFWYLVTSGGQATWISIAHPRS
jgi:hypothetical protein